MFIWIVFTSHTFSIHFSCSTKELSLAVHRIHRQWAQLVICLNVKQRAPYHICTQNKQLITLIYNCIAIQEGGTYWPVLDWLTTIVFMPGTLSSITSSIYKSISEVNSLLCGARAMCFVSRNQSITPPVTVNSGVGISVDSNL